MNLSKASSLSSSIRSQRSSGGSEACSEPWGVSFEACEDGGICAEGGMKSEAFVWEAGGEKCGVCEAGSGASRASGSIEDCDEAWEDACETSPKSLCLSLHLLDTTRRRIAW